jgi:hypothetical protein
MAFATLIELGLSFGPPSVLLITITASRKETIKDALRASCRLTSQASARFSAAKHADQDGRPACIPLLAGDLLGFHSAKKKPLAPETGTSGASDKGGVGVGGRPPATLKKRIIRCCSH